MKRSTLAIQFIIAFISLSAFCQPATTWRGPGQSGIYQETGLLEKWPDSGPEILWSFEGLGVGYGSPAFANDKIYVSGMENTTGYIYCLDQQGKLLWKAQYGKEYHTSYPGSRATPVVDGSQVYMLSGEGDLTCLNSSTGVLRWRKNIFDEFNGRNIMWGINETVVIHGDKLICTPGGTNHNVVALNKLTGELIWSTRARGEKSAYCTPLITKVGNRNLLVTHTADNIIGLDADSGNLLWTHGHTNRYSIHPNTPLIHNNAVFCFSGYGQGGVMLELNSDGSKASKKWFSNTMDSRMGGGVTFNGKIYASGDENRQWQAIDWGSGNVDYTSKEIGNGVIIAAEGKLYMYSQRGELALVNPGPSSFEIISETRVKIGSGQHWAHPVIDQGRLFVRHGKALIAYNISK